MGVWVELLTACRPSATFANEFLYKTETLQPLRLNFYAMQSLRFYKKSISKPAGMSARLGNRFALPADILHGCRVDFYTRRNVCE